MEKLTYISPLQETLHKNPPKLTRNSLSNKEKTISKKSTQLPLIQKSENLEGSNIPIKTLKLEILSLNDIKSPPKKSESAMMKKKGTLNYEKTTVITIPSKNPQKATINAKETQKKIEKKNEEIENALKNLVTVKREALIQRSQLRQNSNKIDNKYFPEHVKKGLTIKRKIPEIVHNVTKKLINFQAETINFKDMFYLEPLESKFSQKMIRREEAEYFDETIKNEGKNKLALVNRKFRQILTKIEKKVMPNTFHQVLQKKNKNKNHLKNDASSKSVEISVKDFNFLTEETKIEKSVIEKENFRKRAASFSHTIPNKNQPKIQEDTLSMKMFSSTQTLISKSVSRESLIEINKKKTEELKKKLRESPFIENFVLDEAVKIETNQEIKGNLFKWKEEMTIGSGTYGRVIKAFEIDGERTIAVKKIDVLAVLGTERNSISSDLEIEMGILKNLHHKNIIEFYGYEKIENSLYLYLEYMSLGNISNLMKSQGPFPEPQIQNYSKQILEGLKYLHDQRIIHKDLKAANILMNDSNTIKLADFGSAQQLERTLTMSLRPGNKNLSIYGSIPWMAPEVIRQTKYGRKADIWSFGCTILEMAQGKAPWSEKNFDNPIAAIMKIGLSEEIPQIPGNLSQNLKDFIGVCLKRDANRRPHAKELLKHPFLGEIL